MKSKITISTLVIIIATVFIYNVVPETIRLPLLKLNRSLSGISTKTMTVGKHTIHYLEGGSGPNIILLHGIFSEKDHWVDFARHLTNDYHVIIPDLAGFGESTRLEDLNYSYEDQVKLFEDYVKALELSSFHIAGNSMGGTIAALYSINHKEKVLSLGFIGAPHGIKTQALSEMDVKVNAGRAPLVPETEEEFEYMLSILFYKRPFIPGPILKYSRIQSLAQSEANLRIFNQQLKDRYLLHSKLTEISVPTIVLWGKNEKIFHPEGAKVLQGNIKTDTFVRLIDTGHLPQMEMSAESADLYKSFLQKNFTQVK